jgi:hypothetical protein
MSVTGAMAAASALPAALAASRAADEGDPQTAARSGSG